MAGRPKRDLKRRNPAAGQWKKTRIYKDFVARRDAQLAVREQKRNYYRFLLKKADEEGDAQGIEDARKLIDALDKPSPKTPAIKAEIREHMAAARAKRG